MRYSENRAPVQARARFLQNRLSKLRSIFEPILMLISFHYFFKKLQNHVLEASWTIFGHLGGVLEASWNLGRLKGNVQGFMGRSWTPLGTSRGRKKSSRTALGRSKRNSKTGFSHLGGQKAPKREPGRVQNGVQNRLRIESGEITKNAIPLARKPYF